MSQPLSRPPRRALVTGAHGFIGRHLARRLAAEGWDVTGLGHGDWPREEWTDWGLTRWIPASVDLGSLASAGPQEAAFHCAGGGSVRFAAENPHEDFARTVSSTAALVEWARTCGSTPAVVLVSSAGVYGNTGPEPVREDRPPRPESVYASHKLMAEDLCRLYAKSFGVRCAVVRLFSVYGPGLRKQLLWDACNRLARGECAFAGTGAETRDWVHVRDAARLLALAASHAGSGCPVANGGSGEHASVGEVVGLLAQLLGAGTPTFTHAARAGDPDRLVSNSALAREWGWRPEVRWRAGVGEYCDWFTAHRPASSVGTQPGGPRR